MHASNVISLGGTTSGSGWRLTISASQFATSGAPPHTLPLTALSVGQGSGATFRGPRVVSGSPDAPDAPGTTPTNALTLTGPLDVPTVPVNGASASSLSPVTFFAAASGVDVATFEIEVPYSLHVPASARAGVYTAAVTITQLASP